MQGTIVGLPKHLVATLLELLTFCIEQTDKAERDGGDRTLLEVREDATKLKKILSNENGDLTIPSAEIRFPFNTADYRKLAEGVMKLFHHVPARIVDGNKVQINVGYDYGMMHDYWVAPEEVGKRLASTFHAVNTNARHKALEDAVREHKKGGKA